jgi:hypothetical protein
MSGSHDDSPQVQKDRIRRIGCEVLPGRVLVFEQATVPFIRFRIDEANGSPSGLSGSDHPSEIADWPDEKVRAKILEAYRPKK